MSSVCLFVCLCVCSLLRYRINYFLPPPPKIGCPKLGIFGKKYGKKWLIKNILQTKSHIGFKGFKDGPFEHIKTFFFPQFFKNVLVNIYEKCIWYQFRIFFTKICKLCPMLVETPYSGGVINPKTYLNHEFGI